MCGRYSQVLSVEDIEEAFGPVTIPGEQLEVNYNVAPTQQAAVITNRDPRQLQLFEWGLVPFWSKDGKNNAKMINARSETILEKPSFRKPVRERRCLVLADSFYEWKREGKSKQPFRIFSPESKLTVFAGIWEYWRDKESDREKLSFSILTTAPNAEMSPVHDRMPVVLAKAELQQAWLDELTDEDITELTQTPPDGTLEMYPVRALVNSVRNNGEDLHARIQGSLFD
jgi:putative SOS response-associated peptidase YedK